MFFFNHKASVMKMKKTCTQIIDLMLISSTFKLKIINAEKFTNEGKKTSKL